jgi:hypothetical protein
METVDFVIQDLVTEKFYCLDDDSEFGEGWRLGDISEAVGLDTEDQAWRLVEYDELTQVTIKKRTTHVTFESI